MLLMGPFAMLSMPSFDFHLPPCTEGFLIHLSPLWKLPLFPSVAQFPCVAQQALLKDKVCVPIALILPSFVNPTIHEICDILPSGEKKNRH